MERALGDAAEQEVPEPGDTLGSDDEEVGAHVRDGR